jgi:hypothetical protein
MLINNFYHALGMCFQLFAIHFDITQEKDESLGRRI